MLQGVDLKSINRIFIIETIEQFFVIETQLSQCVDSSYSQFASAGFRSWESFFIENFYFEPSSLKGKCCLLYTSDAADDRLCVDLGGRSIIKTTKQTTTYNMSYQHMTAIHRVQGAAHAEP